MLLHDFSGFSRRSQESTHLVETLVQDNGTTDILAVEKRYDKLNRITAMAYAAPQNERSSGYVYNDAGLRQYATRGTGEYWHYQYDAMGQVVSAQKHLPNKAAIPGFGYAYAYDTIGNRLSAGRDGDASRLQAYFSEAGATGSPGANELNQYGSRSVPRKLSVVGKAHENATVTVDGNTTTRTGDYFQGIVDFSGESDPDDGRYETIDVQGTYAGEGAGGTDAVAEESTDANVPLNSGCNGKCGICGFWTLPGRHLGPDILRDADADGIEVPEGACRQRIINRLRHIGRPWPHEKNVGQRGKVGCGVMVKGGAN